MFLVHIHFEYSEHLARLFVRCESVPLYCTVLWCRKESFVCFYFIFIIFFLCSYSLREDFARLFVRCAFELK